jgi:ferredoxin
VPKITYLPRGLEAHCADGESIFEVAWREGSPLTTACGGKATCGLCRVKILSGEQFLSPFTPAEKSHLGNVYFITKVRLGCQTRVTGGDVVVEHPPGSIKK